MGKAFLFGSSAIVREIGKEELSSYLDMLKGSQKPNVRSRKAAQALSSVGQAKKVNEPAMHDPSAISSTLPQAAAPSQGEEAAPVKLNHAASLKQVARTICSARPGSVKLFEDYKHNRRCPRIMIPFQRHPVVYGSIRL